MHIYPSILEKKIIDLSNKLDYLLPYFSHFQIDITDGKFVPNKTVQIQDIISTIEQFNNETIKQKSFEFHLMVNDYQSEIAKLDQLIKFVNITSVLIHLKSLNTKYKILNTKYSIGLVLNPDDDVSANIETIMKFPTIQLMTVFPGRQGSPFVPEVLTKIDELRNLGFKGKIILDGSMNDQTLAAVMKRKYLPDAICPGSYFNTDVADRLKRLQQISISRSAKDRSS